MELRVKKKTLIIVTVLVSISILLLVYILVVLTKNNKVSSLPNAQTNGRDLLEIQECYAKPANEQQKCFDEFMAGYFGNKTTREVLADIEAARGMNSTIENECHPITHAVGRYTYQKYGNVGDAFESCDQTCHSGCYHGVMERLFYGDEEITETTQHLTYEDMKDKIPGICDRDKFNNPTQSLIFQCLHGVGHAVLYSLDYNLEDSLKTCGLLADSYQQSSCRGGVIMENVTAFEKAKRDIKKDDPHYPCSKLDNEYKSDCYMMQTSIMFELGLSDEEIARECEKAGDYKDQCHVSLGRDLSNYVRLDDIERVVKACEEYSKGTNQQSCINGTIYALVDNTWDARFAYKYCNALRKSSNRTACYASVNNYMGWAYDKDKTEVESNCNEFAGINVDLCLQSIP